MGARGIAFPAFALAQRLEEAVLAADRLGYPVVLKAQSPELPHKSDAGGVIVGLKSREELVDGWLRLAANLAASRPDLTLDGVLVEGMADKGVELIVGARNDPHWGATILVGGEGSGAIYRFNATTGVLVGTLVGGLARPTGMSLGVDGSLLVLWGNRVQRYHRTSGAALGVLANGADGAISGGTFLALVPNPLDTVFKNGFDTPN